jgi:hypothetical protein
MTAGMGEWTQVMLVTLAPMEDPMREMAAR